MLYVNGAIAWASRKLKVVALSSTEAEIIAGVAACKDIIFVRNILSFIWEPIHGPTPLIIDNEGMWFNVRNAAASARTRYWEIWQQFCRQCYMKRYMSVHLTGTDEEIADILTKAFPKDGSNYKPFRDYMLNMH